MTPQEIKACVNKCKKCLSSNLVSIVLFGSAVTSAKKANDYDLLVITRTLPQAEWKIAGEIKAELMGIAKKAIDLVIMEVEDLTTPSPFLYEVANKNKLLYGPNIISSLKKNNDKIRPIFERGAKVGWKIAQ